MPNAVQNGAILTYIGSWDFSNEIGSSDTVAGVLADIISQLQDSGIVVQGQPTFSAPLFSGPLTVTISLLIQNGIGFGSTNDVLGLVRAAVNTIIGTTPVGDSIAYDQEPNAPQVSTASAQPCSTCNFTDIFTPGGCCTVSKLVSNLETSVAWGIGFILVALLAGVVLLAQGKKIVTT